MDTSKLQNAYIRAIYADQVWNTSPHLQGQGIGVAVVDSGIASHADFLNGLQSRIVASVNFNSLVTSLADDGSPLSTTKLRTTSGWSTSPAPSGARGEAEATHAIGSRETVEPHVLRIRSQAVRIVAPSVHGCGGLLEVAGDRREAAITPLDGGPERKEGCSVACG